eukprot:SAG31_NODE_5477_length_2516_cov_2.390981_1_plen_189_part_00
MPRTKDLSHSVPSRTLTNALGFVSSSAAWPMMAFLTNAKWYWRNCMVYAEFSLFKPKFKRKLNLTDTKIVYMYGFVLSPRGEKYLDIHMYCSQCTYRHFLYFQNKIRYLVCREGRPYKILATSCGTVLRSSPGTRICPLMPTNTFSGRGAGELHVRALQLYRTTDARVVELSKRIARCADALTFISFD